MAEKHWTLDDIPWDRFDPSKVDPEHLKIIKAASLVEYNGEDYARYLCNVFPEDPDFQAAAEGWAVEEVQHGEALGRWAELADPSFDFQAAVARFRAGYSIPIDSQSSVRGSRSGELVARCIVEVAPRPITRRSERPARSRSCARSARRSPPTSCATTSSSTAF